MKINKLLHQQIFQWWRVHGRVLPWREKRKNNFQFSIFKFKKDQTSNNKHSLSLRDQSFNSYFATDTFRDPYRVVVAEIMLQQTQVDRVKPKYLAWMEKWPTITEFANSTLSDVIIEWKGLGYNRRARFLWLLGQEIVKNRNVIWPQTEAELLKLPGIGRYTARAILSFGFGEQVGVVDTNVRRVLGRIFNSEKKEKEWFEFVDSILPSTLADPWNQALMDFGALICTAKSPKCSECPVSHLCRANLSAQKEGFNNFSEKLLAQKPAKKSPQKSKDYTNGVALKFEQTDRFLRGRIIDALREKTLKKEELIILLNTKFTQFNSARIEANILKLTREKMIKIKDEEVSL